MGLTRVLSSLRRRLALRMERDHERLFRGFYRDNLWEGRESGSGPGSGIDQTRRIATELPALFRALDVRRVLDVPCGDFHWMRTVDLQGIEYTGADIVGELIALNQERYGGPGVSFRRLDLLRDPLPAADLILCRDALVHLSFADAASALRNLVRTRARYLLTTTFTARAVNADARTGAWRPLNLEAAPFRFPKPAAIVVEGCTENDGAYADKSLALWPLADLPSRSG